jgi:peptide/nickel transport system substrate-binding protein
MTTPPSRLAGVLVTTVLLAAAAVLWWSARQVDQDESNAARPGAGARAPRRGGQLVASIRAEPRSFNRLLARDQTTDLIDTLTQSPLVRINRATFELEPWLAERWEASADGRSYTLALRRGVEWSDGAPFTSADVVFSARAAFDPAVESVLASSLLVAGQPVHVAAPDAHTVVVTFAGPSGPGLRLLDQLSILPKHKLEAALARGAFKTAWDTRTDPPEVVGTGAFVLREYQPGQRVVLDRNPRYWRKASDGGPLPYLDRIVLEVVPDQNAELVRLQAGEIDLTNSELRPEDYVPVRRAEQEGRLRMIELGIGPDADAFWFCLKPEAKARDPRFTFVQRPEFRRALSHAVDREEFAQAVFLGEAVPVWGPVTPGNTPWFTPNLPRYPYDPARARALLAGIGLEDRNGNGVVEDASGTEARFTVITQRGLGWYERGTAVLREQAARVGIALDIAPLEFGAMITRMLACDYDAIYMRPLATDLDPAGNLDMWLSSGSAHFWNLEQRAPATEWERRIDILMLEQASTVDPGRRRALFEEAQRIFAENLPALYFAAPRLYYAHHTRVIGVVPSILRPPALWNADALGVDGLTPGAPR